MVDLQVRRQLSMLTSRTFQRSHTAGNLSMTCGLFLTNNRGFACGSWKGPPFGSVAVDEVDVVALRSGVASVREER